MQPENDIPFTGNKVCKFCLGRPCRRLFSGYVYPGKMIFVHRRELLSLPCHQPNFCAQDAEEEAALTDDIPVASANVPVTVTNPRWEHVDEARKSRSPDVARIGDNVMLSADISGIPNGAPVTFDIFDVTDTPSFRIGSASGSNENGTASGTWIIDDPNGHGADLKLEFEAIARSKASERAPIDLIDAFRIHLQIDVDDPAAKDDTLILLDEGGAEVLKLCIGDMKEVSEDIVCLTFEGLDMDTRYSLVRDYGPDEEGGQDPLFVNLTLNEVKELFKD